MNPYFTEVIDAHIAIERWLGKGAGEEQALLARFTPDFSMIALSGAPLDFAALCAFSARIARQTGIGNRDRRDEAGGRMADGRVVSYREKQSLPGQSATLRYSTVVFERQPNVLGWRHLHETAAAQ